MNPNERTDLSLGGKVAASHPRSLLWRSAAAVADLARALLLLSSQGDLARITRAKVRRRQPTICICLYTGEHTGSIKPSYGAPHLGPPPVLPALHRGRAHHLPRLPGLLLRVLPRPDL